METLVEVGLSAINLVRKTELAVEDKGVPGVYQVALPASLLAARRAHAALNVFHATVPVAQLDDFAFVVFDPVSREILPETVEHLAPVSAQLTQVSYRPFQVYHVLVQQCVPPTGASPASTLKLGAVMVAGVNRREAVGFAHSYLDRKGQVPRGAKLSFTVMRTVSNLR